MATFNTAFGSLPGYKEMMGTTNTTAGGEEKQPTVYGGQTQTQRTTQQPAQTFAQMQQRGMARPPAPTGPTASPFAQYGGSQQGQQLRSQLQQRLTEFGQAPSRYDTESFKQIRGAQAANLQSEYGAQQKALNEDLARRGLSASSIGGGRMGDLAGQQARALSSLDAQLLQQAADTQAQDRAQLLQSGQGLAELAGSQDLAQFEANRVAQAATFENQLRASEFGQRQYEQAGQEAFQGAQAEETSAQAARQFDLSALGQTAGLSLDLQRLLGSQEVERAGLTGQLGGVETLAGQQQAEQRRQFDIQQRLQEQLGLGGLDVQQQEVGIKQQALQQQATDAAAERTLRETLQTRELNAQEKQQLADITSRRELQTQQITEQARQFGINITEQQADRLQKNGISTEELKIRRDQVANDFLIQGRQLDETVLNNEAIRGLEADKFEADKLFKADQFGLNKKEVENRALQIQEDQRLKGIEIGNEQAYREAEIEARTTQIANEFKISGQQITTDNARIQAQKEIAAADNLAQSQRLTTQITGQKDIAALDRGVQEKQLAFQNAARLSEQSGVQYTVNAQGQPEVLRDAAGQPIKTSADSRAAEALKQEKSLFDASLQQRLQEFLTQQTGNLYGLGADGKAVASTGTTIGGQTASYERALEQAKLMSAQTGQTYNVSRDANGMYSTVPVGGQTQSALELQLRKALGMSEVSGYVYDPVTGQRTTAQTVESQQANNQLFMQLASVLSGLTPEQQAKLRSGEYSAPAQPVVGQIDGAWRWTGTRWEPTGVE